MILKLARAQLHVPVLNAEKYYEDVRDFVLHITGLYYPGLGHQSMPFNPTHKQL